MRLVALPLLCLSSLPAMAQEEMMDGEMPMGGIYFSTSISVNAPMTATDAMGKEAEEDAYRQRLYVRAVKECEGLLATIATTCEVTNVSVSTQVTASPGQPDYLYGTANISMNVELK